jgi:hypothetical protein
MRLVERLTSLAVCVASLEYLSRPQQFRDQGLMSWPVSKLRYKWLASGPWAAVLGTILSYPAILLLILLRLFAALALLAAPLNKTTRTALTAGLAISSIGINLKSSYGQDGSDQMSTITLTALTLGKLSPSNRMVQEASLWFIALQACLSYAASGWAKVAGPSWREGSALTGIFRTKVYGQEGAYKFLKARPRLARWVARIGVFWECTFPLVLVVPKPAVGLFLLSGVLFHGANAVLMGLNRFFWAFVATYPAIVYCTSRRPNVKR